MSWTKGQIAAQAFADLALAGYVFDLSPEAQIDAVQKLDAMMALWDVKGIRVGYEATQDSGNSDPDQESGIPDWCNEAASANLALRICSGFGKTPSSELKTIAKDGYDTVLAKCLSTPPEMQYPSTMPRGAGYRLGRPYYPFMPRPVDPVEAGPDGPLEFS